MSLTSGDKGDCTGAVLGFAATGGPIGSQLSLTNAFVHADDSSNVTTQFSTGGLAVLGITSHGSAQVVAKNIRAYASPAASVWVHCSACVGVAVMSVAGSHPGTSMQVQQSSWYAGDQTSARLTGQPWVLSSAGSGAVLGVWWLRASVTVSGLTFTRCDTTRVEPYPSVTLWSGCLASSCLFSLLPASVCPVPPAVDSQQQWTIPSNVWPAATATAAVRTSLSRTVTTARTGWSLRGSSTRSGSNSPTRSQQMLPRNVRDPSNTHTSGAAGGNTSRRRPSLDATCTPTGDDPLQQLPHDLAARIFATLPPHSRARCAAVCRSWRDMLRDLPAEQLWGNLDFTADPACKVRFTFHFIFF